MKKERADKIISSQSTITRSETVKLIRSGKVKINGEVIKDNSLKIDPQTDVIEINGEVLNCKKFIYIMMNKPGGVVSVSRSPKERTALELLPDNLKRPGLFPAGRLDKDTTGFLLITNDGEFAHSILSPKRHIKKTYLASTSDYIPEKGLEEMRAGMVMDGEELLPAEVSLFKEGTNSSGPVYKITLCQGKYHQIKRMTALAGGALTSLERISMGNLTLDPELAPGEARELTETEVELIRQGQK